MLYSTHLLRHLRLIIGSNMRRLRMERKLTLGKLSEIAGVPESKIDHYELGKNELPLDHMFKIACALDVEIEGYSPA